MDFRFINSIDELINSTYEFFSKPEFWKATIGNAPRYFIHFISNGNHFFGLSKFCAFNNISVEEYISIYRYQTDGGKTQKHLSKITQQKWISINEVNEDLKNEFNRWIINFHPNYNLDNASFITISSLSLKNVTKRKFVTPHQLEKRLNLQNEIGEIGEIIAIEYEKKRLLKMGINNPEKYVEHTSKVNIAAGFDISSLSKEQRFIEVKSSLNSNLSFYITENEYNTLEQLNDNAYIYFVHITNINTKEGKVIKELKNPINKLKKTGKIKPIAYKVNFDLK